MKSSVSACEELNTLFTSTSVKVALLMDLY